MRVRTAIIRIARGEQGSIGSSGSRAGSKPALPTIGGGSGSNMQLGSGLSGNGSDF